MKLQLGILLSLMMFAGPTYAVKFIKMGVDNSGGGKAVVCRTEDKKIRTIEILDLFEGNAIYGLTPEFLGLTKDEILNTVKEKFKVAFWGTTPVQIHSWIDQAIQDFRLLPPQVELQPVDDALPIALPIGCQLEQLAYYKDNSDLLVNRELWEALDPANQAALFVHEAVYRRFRAQGERDSRNARKITAHYFSNQEIEPLLQGVPNQSAQCFGDVIGGGNIYKFHLYPSSEPGKDIYQFEVIRGQVPFTKTTIKVETKVPGRDFVSDFLIPESKFENFDGVRVIRSEASANREAKFAILDGDKEYRVMCVQLRMGPNPDQEKEEPNDGKQH